VLFGHSIEPHFRGTALMSEAALQDMIDTSASLGWQLGIHAVGDKAIVTVADTYARALKKYSKQDARWYLAHLSMIPPASTLDLMARNRIFAAVQPLGCYDAQSLSARVNRCLSSSSAHVRIGQQRTTEVSR
jgi:predicted amidohydrolase YtcJ